MFKAKILKTKYRKFGDKTICELSVIIRDSSQINTTPKDNKNISLNDVLYSLAYNKYFGKQATPKRTFKFVGVTTKQDNDTYDEKLACSIAKAKAKAKMYYTLYGIIKNCQFIMQVLNFDLLNEKSMAEASCEKELNYIENTIFN